MLGGVCAGLARTWGVDPLLVRAGLVVAAVVTSGFALLLYAVLWLVVPNDKTMRPRRGPRSALWLLALLLAVVVLVVPQSRFVGVGIGLLALVAFAWYAMERVARRPRGPRSLRSPAPWAGAGASGPGPLAAPTGDLPGPAGPTQWRQPPRARYHETLGAWSYDQPPVARPRVWRRVILVTLASWAVLAVLDAVGVGVGAIAYPAAALAVIGLTLVAAARPERAASRRPRGLVPAGLVAALVTLVLIPASGTTHASTQSFGSITDPTQLPARIEVAAGTHTVDLSALSLDEDRTVTIVQDAGSLTLLLPKSADVSARYQVDMGRVETPQQNAQGMDIDVSEWYSATAGRPVLTVVVELDMGNVEVHR